MATLDGQKSEKEDIDTNVTIQEQSDEIPPMSSPEGVFKLNEVEVNSLSNIPHVEINDDLTQNNIKIDETPVLNHEEEISDIIPDEQQIISDPNSIFITPEDLYEAGFDADSLDTLTDEQLNVLIAISEQRMAKQNGEHHSTEQIDSHVINSEEVPSDDQAVTIVLSEDGGLDITDQSNQKFYISPEQLQQLNININNLTEENVQLLFQIAVPSLMTKDDETKNAVPLDIAGPSTSYVSQYDEKDIVGSLIGQTVRVRMSDGQLQEAVVRYIRGNEYKIQFDNGDFAYANLDQLILSNRYRNSRGFINRSKISQSDAPSLKRVSSSTPGTSNGNNDQICPPVLKRSYHPPLHEQQTIHMEPNFCCPVCDKKVYQKEPAYIVIRLPACDSCTREKIIVLEDQNS